MSTGINFSSSANQILATPNAEILKEIAELHKDVKETLKNTVRIINFLEHRVSFIEEKRGPTSTIDFSTGRTTPLDNQ